MGLEQKEDIIKKLAELNKKKYVGRKWINLRLSLTLKDC